MKFLATDCIFIQTYQNICVLKNFSHCILSPIMIVLLMVWAWMAMFPAKVGAGIGMVSSYVCMYVCICCTHSLP